MSDQNLLCEYSERRSEAAFAELVRRRVDLVYSTARRIVRDAHLAEEVTQSVFLALAQNAAKLLDRPAVSPWLHRTTQNLAANAVRSDVRRRLREEKAAAMNEVFTPNPASEWESIESRLDQVLETLSESDRETIMLRFFEGKSAAEIARTLGVSDEAAQKRVTRALEKLRDRFGKTGVPIAVSSLAALLSANVIQAAPAGLALSISTATIATASATTITLAMTTLQKAALAGTFAILLGTGIYEANRASSLQTELQTLQQQQAPAAAELKRLQQQSDSTSARLEALTAENQRLKTAAAEVPALRGELARLRSAPARQLPDHTLDPKDPGVQNFLAARAQAEQITHYLEAMPEKTIPEIALLGDIDWLRATKEAKFDSDADIRRTLSTVRALAKERLPIGGTLNAFLQAHDGVLPNDLSELKPFLQAKLGEKQLPDAVLDGILQRYTLVHTGKVSDLPPDAWMIVEKAPVDKEYDTRAKFGNGRSTVISTGLNQSGDPDDKTY